MGKGLHDVYKMKYRLLKQCVCFGLHLGKDFPVDEPIAKSLQVMRVNRSVFKTTSMANCSKWQIK